MSDGPVTAGVGGAPVTGQEADDAVPGRSSYGPGSYSLVGPFQTHYVQAYGRKVPFLEAGPMNGGKIHLSLDSRFGLDLTVEEAEHVIPFIADCIAVAAGYTCHPREGEESCRTTPFPRMHSILFTETDDEHRDA